MKVLVVLAFSLFAGQVGAEYVEISVTSGQPIFSGNNSIIDLDNLRVRKVNRSDHLLFGTFELFEDLGNDFDVNTIFYKKSGNEYRKTPFHLGPRKLCDYLKKESVSYEAMLEVSDIPAKGVCPWPKNKYHVNGFLLPLDKIPENMEDDWMAETSVLRNNKLINAYQLYFTIIRI